MNHYSQNLIRDNPPCECVVASLGGIFFSMANMAIDGSTKQAYIDYAESVIVSKTYEYEGNPVSFSNNGAIMVSATQMAKPFGKLVGDWLRLKSTEEFVNALSSDMQIPISALIKVVKGGNAEQGTWLHEDVALEFARWLSPKFAIWCNRRIKELLTKGTTSIAQLSRKELALMVIQAEEEKERLMIENKAQADKIAEDAPKVEFHDNVVASSDTCLVRELAKILTQRGFKIGQYRLYEILRNEGYLAKSGADYNQPTQQYVERGLFEVDRKPWTDPKGQQHIGKTSKVTPKGIKYFVRKFLGRAAVL